MFDWYRDAHGATPRQRGQALSRIYRLWISLPSADRAEYCTRAERTISDWNRARAEERRIFETARQGLMVRMRELIRAAREAK